jgi:hypothetical protein
MAPFLFGQNRRFRYHNLEGFVFQATLDRFYFNDSSNSRARGPPIVARIFLSHQAPPVGNVRPGKVAAEISSNPHTRFGQTAIDKIGAKKPGTADDQ